MSNISKLISDAGGQDVTPSYLNESGYEGHSAIDKQRITLELPKCPHSALKLVSSTEVKCTQCGAGWTGPGAYKLIE